MEEFDQNLEFLNRENLNKAGKDWLYTSLNILARIDHFPGSSRIDYTVYIKESENDVSPIDSHYSYSHDCRIVDFLFVQIKINNFVLIVVD